MDQLLKVVRFSEPFQPLPGGRHSLRCVSRLQQLRLFAASEFMSGHRFPHRSAITKFFAPFRLNSPVSPVADCGVSSFDEQTEHESPLHPVFTQSPNVCHCCCCSSPRAFFIKSLRRDGPSRWLLVPVFERAPRKSAVGFPAAITPSQVVAIPVALHPAPCVYRCFVGHFRPLQSGWRV